MIKIGNRFKQNIKNKKRVRLIIKIDEGVKDRGLLEVKGFYNGFVRLGKV